MSELVSLGLTAPEISSSTDGSAPAVVRKRRPEWLRIRLATPDRYRKVKAMVDGLNLHTVCQEARCPNIYECWGEHGTATLMILGDTCTRRCGFCAVKTGRPPLPPDPLEPENVAQAVSTMSLRHAVITSVDRDDLKDGGAQHFADVIRAIKDANPETAVEVLTPDFRNVSNALDIVLGARPEVFSHNMETVPKMYRAARPGSSYQRSLALLADAAKRRDAGTYQGTVKTAIMVGLGETDEELKATMRDIREAGVEVLAIGQYLQPTKQHLEVDRYMPPSEFAQLGEYGKSLGFTHCEAGPLVRSSYHAHEHVGRKLR